MQMKKNDKDLFKEIISVQSSSSDDKDINEYIVSKISKIPNVKISKDAFGNIYATKGSGKSGYKCIVCHTDTVHRLHKERYVMEIDNIVFSVAKTTDIAGKHSTINQVGTGGDDKNGVYTCIKALIDFDNVKSVFFRFEESGCRGSSASDIQFFKDCNFVVQCDRRGNSDFITNVSGSEVASSEFVSTMKPLYEKYGYKETYGLSTDVGALKRKGLEVSAINMSCGYHDPHTNYETCNLNDLQKCYDLVTDMFNAYGDRRFEHKYVEKVYTSYSTTRTYTSKFSKPKFSYDLTNNFFCQKEDIEVEFKDNLFSMIQIPGTKKYKLIFDEYVFYDNLGCPVCGEKDELAFYTDISMFYCCHKSHSEFILSDELYINAILEQNGINFVYDRIYDVWYKDEDANYNVITNSYELR